ncbi:MAG: response regulator transcription factor [Anaerolineae bacterium]|nr:response regulator transcription factor [Anaerolineae bacterium]
MIDRRIRVLLADDHPFMRAGIRATPASEGDVSVVGEASNADEALQLAMQLKPDVLLLDLHMPGSPAGSVVEELKRRCPNVRVLVLTAYDDDVYVQGMLALGVAGYVLKDEVPEALVRALRAVYRGDTWFSTRALNALARSRQAYMPQDGQGLFTERELEILRLMMVGKTDREIADELVCAERTVRYHLRGIFGKLGVDSRVEAAVRAAQLNLGGREGTASDSSAGQSPS